MGILESIVRIFSRSRAAFRDEGYKVLQIPLLLPELLHVPLTPQSMRDTVQVDLGNMTCECEEWSQAHRNLAPIRSIGRCCRHMVDPVYQRLCRDRSVSLWTLAILQASSTCPPPAKSEMATFSNGKDEFLAFYDVTRGYVQLYGPLQSCQQFGYDHRINRWSWGTGPENPMAIKKTMRPWAKILAEKYGHSSQPML